MLNMGSSLILVPIGDKWRQSWFVTYHGIAIAIKDIDFARSARTSLCSRAAQSTAAPSAWIFPRASPPLFYWKAFDIYWHRALVLSTAFFYATRHLPQVRTAREIPQVICSLKWKITFYKEIFPCRINRTSIFSIPGSIFVSLALSLLCLSSNVSFTLDSSSVD